MRYLFKKNRLAAAAAVLDAVGGALFFWSRRVPRNASKRVYLVVRLDHLGDVLFASAIPKLLKENLEARRVIFLTSSAGAALMENNPFVDEVLVYDAPWFSRSKGGRRGTFWEIVRRLRKINVNVALSLRGDLRENFLLFVSGAKERVGYGVTGGGFFLNWRVEYRHGAHEREHALDLLKAAGIPNAALRPTVYFTDQERSEFMTRMRQWGIADRPVGLQLEAGASAKEWPEANVRELLSLSAKKLSQTPLVFIGTDAKKKTLVSDFLKEHPSLPWKNLIGETSLREMLFLAGRCRFFAGLDSGPTHAAACAGVPTLFLYSGTNRFEEWRSLEEGAEFLRNPVPCSPCHSTHCFVEGHPCMSGISAESVVRWMEERNRAS